MCSVTLFVACSGGDATGPENAHLSANVQGACEARYVGDAHFDTHDLYVHSSNYEASGDEITSIRLASLGGVTRPGGTLASFDQLGTEPTLVSGVIIKVIQGRYTYATREARLSFDGKGDGFMAGGFSFRAYRICDAETEGRCTVPREVSTDAPWIEVTGDFVASRWGDGPPQPLDD